jgi:putative hemolysin
VDLPIYISIILLLFLTYAGAWISSAETALFSLPAHRVNLFKTEKGSTKQLIAKLLSTPRDLLVTVFMINTFINIVLQNVASDMFRESSWTFKVGVPLVVTLIFGEVIPKYLGLQNNQAIALKCAPTLERLSDWLAPVRKMVIAITSPLSRILFFFLRRENVITKSEIEHVIKTSKNQGVLTTDEAELLAGYLNLSDAEVKELMQPKEDIHFYDIDEPLSALERLFIEEECTRVPVCKGDIDHVLGIISSMRYFREKERKEVVEMLAKPYYVPETMQAKALLRKMNEIEERIALVVDEYGSICGLIAREDLIAVVIGQIDDPTSAHDLYIPAGHNEAIASGKWDLADFNTYFDADLKSHTGMVSIGGWLVEMHGDIPKSGEKIELQGFLFHVLAAQPTRITRLFIKRVG